MKVNSNQVNIKSQLINVYVFKHNLVHFIGSNLQLNNVRSKDGKSSN